jgi:hypothetical protein
MRNTAWKHIPSVCLTILLAGSLLFSMLSVAPAVAYAAPSYKLSASSSEPIIGREVKVEVTGEALDDVYAAELQATFDAGHLRFKGASSTRFGYAVEPAVNGNQIVLAFTKVGPKDGESGTVVLAELVFEATTLGSGSVGLTKVKTVDSKMNVVDHDANAVVNLKVVAAPVDPGPTPGPGSPGDSEGETPVVVDDEDGSVTITPTPVIDGSTAAAKIDESTWLKALAKAKKMSNGFKKVQLVLTGAPGGAAHTLELPAAAFSPSAEAVMIEISTPLGTVTVPNHMFRDGVQPAGDVEFRVEQADSGGWDKALREQIGNRPAIDWSVSSGGQDLSWNNPNAPATIRIPYRPMAAERAHLEHLTIWRIDEQGRATVVPSARYDVSTGEMLFQTADTGTFAVTFVQKTFEDLGKVDWAKSAIEVMASKGIINGVSAVEFRPGASITRADFALLLVRTMGLEGVKGEAFADVEDGAYYADAVAVLRGLGITAGTGDNQFRPGAAITRQDMMVLIAKALAHANKAVPAPAESLSGFIDADNVAGYARESVAELIHAGLVKGSNQKINPKAWTTRAETAVLMYRLYNYFYK